MFKSILVPYDGSPFADKAINIAVSIAKENHSEITIVNIVPTPIPTVSTAALLDGLSKPDTTPELEKAREMMKKITDIGIKYLVYSGDPAETILKAADNDKSDIIVMGSRGLSGFEELLLGSVSSKVIQLSKIPVLVAK